MQINLNNLPGQIKGYLDQLDSGYMASPEYQLKQKMARVGFGGLTPEEQNAFIAPYMNTTMGMTSAPKQLISNAIGQRMAQIGQKMDILGNVPMVEHNQVQNAANQVLKIPQKMMGKLGTKGLLSEIRGMLTPEQAIQFKEPYAKMQAIEQGLKHRIKP